MTLLKDNNRLLQEESNRNLVVCDCTYATFSSYVQLAREAEQRIKSLQDQLTPLLRMMMMYISLDADVCTEEKTRIAAERDAIALERSQLLQDKGQLEARLQQLQVSSPTVHRLCLIY